MRFFADMGVSMKVVEWLRASGTTLFTFAMKGCNAYQMVKYSEWQRPRQGQFWRSTWILAKSSLRLGHPSQV